MYFNKQHIIIKFFPIIYILFLLLYYKIIIFFTFVSPLIAYENLPLGQRVLPKGLEQPRQQIKNVLGGIYSKNITLYFRNSPFRVQSDLIIESGATINIETGVQMYFDTGVGIKVYGTIKAIGNEFAHIQMLPYQQQLNYDYNFPEFRLIDGPSVRQGRLQVKFRNRWRSICSMMTNWTSIDYTIACRSLGYSDGGFWRYYRRNNDTYPFAMPLPNCLPSASNLWKCEGFSDINRIPLTENLCQGEDDVGLYCWGIPTFIGWAKHWKGLQIFSSPFKYVHADLDLVSMQRESLSRLEFIDILYGGYNGYTKNTTAALYIEGVPPIINGLRVEHSARDGIYFYESQGPIIIANSTIKHNRGHGIAIDNTIDARFFLNQSIVSNNYGDGIWYKQHHGGMSSVQNFYGFEIFGHEFNRKKRQTTYYEKEKPRIDMCFEHQISNDFFFPHLIKATSKNESISSLPFELPFSCWLIISLPPRLRYSYTIQFLEVKILNMLFSNSNFDFIICDGNNTFTNICQNERYRIPLKNNFLPQSITLANNKKPLFIGLDHHNTASKTVFNNVELLFKIHASVTDKAFYGLNITNSVILNNTGNGVQVINARDRTAISNASIKHNEGIAGFLVKHGAADIWLNDTSFNYNWGDGINISYAGGSINLNSSRLIGNHWRGFSFHYNESIPFLSVHKEIIIKGRPGNNIYYPKMIISKNLWGGILIGNVCISTTYQKQFKVLINWSEFLNNTYHPAIEIISCQKKSASITTVDISGNNILDGTGMGFRMEPCVNAYVTINSNQFHYIKNSALLIRNSKHPHLHNLPAKVFIYKNNIKMNKGNQFIVSIGLNENSLNQKLIFDQQNELRSNTVINPFPFLNPRSSAYAALVVSSSNVVIQHNCFSNPNADYEIATELMEHAKRIDARKNNWGSTDPQIFMRRIFDQFNRYSLAVIDVNPFAAVCNQRSPALTYLQQFYRQFQRLNQPNVIGGTIYENSDLPPGTYTVVDDLHITAGSKLTLASGTRLEFTNGVGMLVQGELLRTDYVNPLVPITFTSKLYSLSKIENIRLVDEMGNENVLAGRLEVRLDDGLWGTVCNRSWTAKLSQLVCNQLGLIMDSQYFENWQIFPDAGDLPIRMDNIRCEEREYDLTKCRHDGLEHNCDSPLSCKPTEVVGIRCAEPRWAGVRYSLLANPPLVTGQITMHNWIIEKAGLFDFKESIFSSALQIDWNYYAFNLLTIRNNFYNGLDIIYNDLTKKPAIRNSLFLNNRRNGIVIRSNGITIDNVVIEGNANAGIRYNPKINAVLQHDIVSWLSGREQFDLEANNIQNIPANVIKKKLPENLNKFDLLYDKNKAEHIRLIPNQEENIIYLYESQLHQRIFLVAKPSENCPIEQDKPCIQDYVLKAIGNQFGMEPKLAIQIINRWHNESDEDIIFSDYYFSDPVKPIKHRRIEWSVRQHTIYFPIVSSGSILHMRYTKTYGKPSLVLLILFLDAQEYLDRFIHVYQSIIRRNQYAVSAVHYNNLTFSDDAAVLLRNAEEKIWFQKVNFTQNIEAVVWLYSPQQNVLDKTPIAQITWHIDNCSIVDNYGPIVSTHRDYFSSANVFFWYFWSNTFANNSNLNIQIQLPDTYNLLANQKHKILITENRFEKNNNFMLQINGYYGFVNISSNNFTDNYASKDFGILELKGMERWLIVERNRFFNNKGNWMIRVDTSSQTLHEAEKNEIFAFIQYNYFQFNFFAQKIDDYVDMWPRSYALGVFGVQKVNVHFNRFRNVLMDFELVAGCNSQFPSTDYMNVTYNWWGVANEAEVSQRIFDLDDWNIFIIAQYSPYYTAEELFINFWWNPYKAQLSYANYSEPSILDLKGRMYKSKTLSLDVERWYSFPYYYRPFRPYRITKDLTIMPGATLTIERNVEIHVWPNVRILVLGNLVADGTLWQPIRFKPINSTEFFEQHGKIGTRYRRFNLKKKRFVKRSKKNFESVELDFYDDDQNLTNDSELWNRRKKKGGRNFDTLWWKRYRRRNKRHDIDSRFVEFQMFNRKNHFLNYDRKKRSLLKLNYFENIDVFRKFPEIRRYDANIQKFSVFLTENNTVNSRSGFLMFYNHTTGETVPSCDRLFTLRNAQVVCKELGYEYENAYHWHIPRYDYIPQLKILKSYVEPRQCRGTESQLDKCEIRLNKFLSNWQCVDSMHFNYIHCGASRAISSNYIDHWGGITFAPTSLDYNALNTKEHSILRHVEIVGGGIAHNDSLQSAALQIIRRSPILENINVTNSSMHAVQIISPTDNIILSRFNVSNNKGQGINVISSNLFSSTNSYNEIPNSHLSLPYAIPGLLNVCAAGKLVEVQSRVLIFYKYDSYSVDCVKIFRAKNFNNSNRVLNFRFLQFNLNDKFNGLGRVDALSIYSGASFLPSHLWRRFDSTFTTKQTNLQKINENLIKEQNKLIEKFTTIGMHLRATAADGYYGFIAEVSVTSSVLLSKNVEEIAVRNSRLLHNDRGAFFYLNVGEISPSLIIEQCSIEKNGYFLYGNVSTSYQALELHLHNTLLLLFRGNSVRLNRGGLLILAKSSSLIAPLNVIFKNNAFIHNSNSTVLTLIGNNNQKATFLNNIIGMNIALYFDTILIFGFSTNFTENLIIENIGLHTIDMQSSNVNVANDFILTSNAVAGTLTNQIFKKNFFIKNLACGHSFQFTKKFGYLPYDSEGNFDNHDEFRRRPKRQINDLYEEVSFDWWAHVGKETSRYSSTILLGSASFQKFENNIFDNSQNSYELTTSPQSHRFDNNAIDARNNFWGYPSTSGVASGKIRDYLDYPYLSRVEFEPVLQSNATLIDGDCDAGYFQLGNEEFKSCFRFIGASMTYADAVQMCEEMGAFMPILRNDDSRRREIANRVDFFERKFIVDLERYSSFGMLYDIPIWISSVTLPSHQCGWMSSRTASIGEQNCNNLLPFVCEKGTKSYQEPILWRQDIIMAVTLIVLLFILVSFLILLALCKAQKRKENFAKQKTFIRNSIRQKSQTFDKLKKQINDNQINNCESTELKTKNLNNEKTFNNSEFEEIGKEPLYESCCSENSTHTILSNTSSLPKKLYNAEKKTCVNCENQCKFDVQKTCPKCAKKTKNFKKPLKNKNFFTNLNSNTTLLSETYSLPYTSLKKNLQETANKNSCYSITSSSGYDCVCNASDITDETINSSYQTYSTCCSTQSTGTENDNLDSTLNSFNNSVSESATLTKNTYSTTVPFINKSKIYSDSKYVNSFNNSTLPIFSLDKLTLNNLNYTTRTLKASSRPDLSQRSTLLSAATTSNKNIKQSSSRSNPNLYSNPLYNKFLPKQSDSLQQNQIFNSEKNLIKYSSVNNNTKNYLKIHDYDCDYVNLSALSPKISNKNFNYDKTNNNFNHKFKLVVPSKRFINRNDEIIPLETSM